MTDNVNADYVSSPEAARILRITYVGVAQLARQGKIPAVKIANRWLIPRAFVEEFARTYEGRRGRPRKKKPFAGVSGPLAAILPAQEALAGMGSGGLVISSEPESVEIRVAPAPGGHLAEPAVFVGAQPVEPPIADAVPDHEGAASTEPGPSAAPHAVEPGGQLEDIAAAVDPAREAETAEAAPAPEVADTVRPGDATFSISAQVYHLDKNYDFEVYEKGEITERARLIVARLKPKIPSLPQFSFRWDYRYEHLNVDIHGVEPAVADWWTMGENGYTGHLPRRLAGPGYTFEAIIWLPVTFVFRGRLALSLQGSSPEEEESPSVATTTGGLRRLWTRWTGTTNP